MRCRMSCYGILCAIFLLILIGSPLAGAAARLKPSPAANVRGLYKPQPGHFQNWYNADRANQQRQTWDGYQQYWYWVAVFYDANECSWRDVECHASKVRSMGWTVDSQRALNCSEGNDEVRRLLNNVGWYVAAEWSKDNGVRKINYMM